MRRNAVTVAKYLVFGALILTLGLIVIKAFLNNHSKWTSNDESSRQHHLPQGLPIDPDVLQVMSN